MKTLFAAIFALSSGLTMAQNKATTTTYKLDPSKTKITWVGKKVSGQHDGTVALKSGTLVYTGDELTGGEIIVDMNKMTVTDITDKGTAEKFLTHMKSADFFDTAKYPETKFVITNSKKTDKGLEVNGKLTMVGQTKDLKKPMVVTDYKKTDSTVSGKAAATIDRTQHGLRYGSGQFFKGLGDRMIYDDFTLDITFSATK